MEPLIPLSFFFFFSPQPHHISVSGCDGRVGVGARGCSSHGSVKNHSWCKAIIAGSLSSHPPPLCFLHPTSLNPSPFGIASLLPSIIPSSLVRKLGWHLAVLPPASAFLFFPVSLPLCVQLLLHVVLTHYSQFSGWYMDGDTGPIQSRSPFTRSARWSDTGSPVCSGSSLSFLFFVPSSPFLWGTFSFLLSPPGFPSHVSFWFTSNF